MEEEGGTNYGQLNLQTVVLSVFEIIILLCLTSRLLDNLLLP